MKLKALAAGTVVAVALDYVLPAPTAPFLDQPESVALVLVALSVAVVLLLDRRA